jgi:ribonucleotide reductase alpha subunit
MADWSTNAKVILESRYLARDKKGVVTETPDGMLERVAKCVADAEKPENQKIWEEKFLGIMNSLEFLPNSPTLINAGRGLGQLSACFVLPVNDDISNIFEMVKQSALIHKTGGGTGFNFSELRPAGSTVASTHGVASGPVSFMRAFVVVKDVIKQGGVRRGANIGILNVTHPDIVEFVDCKKDTTLFQNFNISVAINDGFFDLLEDDGYLQLHYWGFPYKEKIKASDLFNKMCENSWANGEPGFLFIDTINKHNPTPWLGPIKATNPCVTGDTRIAVADGRGSVSIKQLVDEGNDVPVYCKDSSGWTHIRYARNPRLTGVKKPILKVTLDDGSFIRTTNDHKFYLSDGSKVEANKLVVGDSLMRFDRYQFTYREQGLPYWGVQKAVRNTFQEHRLISEFVLGRPLTDDERVHHKDFNGLNNDWTNLQSMTLSEHANIHDISGDNNPMRRFPDKNWMNNPDMQREMREKHHVGAKRSDVTCANISESIKNAFEKNPSYRTKLSDRMKELWQTPEYREKMLMAIGNRTNHKVMMVEFDGYEDVYNITVDDFHNYCVVTSDTGEKQSGITVANCGEAPLLPWESCNLGSINLSKFVVDGVVDFIRLIEVVNIAVRFLDNIIDVNKYPRVQIDRKTKLTRKIGLGVMGWADMLGALGIEYDTQEAVDLAENVMGCINSTAKHASEILAKERKPCFRALHRRNACLTTIAPTGTLSILADCSSGIEPYFSLSYKKHVVNGTNLDFVVPYKVKTAMGISPEWHIRVQAAFQKHVDQAVSKTINLPNESTVEDVKDAVLLGYTLGCKGMTLYRQGTREAPMQEALSECIGDKCMI